MLTHWDSFSTGARLRNEMNRLFSEYFDDSGEFVRGSGARTFPPMNVWEDAEMFRIEAELPGIKMEDLEISVLGREVMLKGERKPLGGEKVSYHRRERGVGPFARTIRLPGEVDSEKVNATLKDGVLELQLIKARAAMPRKIEVKCE